MFTFEAYHKEFENNFDALKWNQFGRQNKAAKMRPLWGESNFSWSIMKITLFISSDRPHYGGGSN